LETFAETLGEKSLQTNGAMTWATTGPTTGPTTRETTGVIWMRVLNDGSTDVAVS
jgi:hypothetical protein